MHASDGGGTLWPGMRLYGRACCEHRCPPSRKTGHAAWKRMVCRCSHPPRRPETCPTCPQTAVCHGADCGLGGRAARCGGSGGAVWWVSTIAGGRAARPAVPESARAHSSAQRARAPQSPRGVIAGAAASTTGRCGGTRVLSHAACSAWSARFGRYHARWRVLKGSGAPDRAVDGAQRCAQP